MSACGWLEQRCGTALLWSGSVCCVLDFVLTIRRRIVLLSALFCAPPPRSQENILSFCRIWPGISYELGKTGIRALTWADCRNELERGQMNALAGRRGPHSRQQASARSNWLLHGLCRSPGHALIGCEKTANAPGRCRLKNVSFYGLSRRPWLNESTPSCKLGPVHAPIGF